MRGIWNKYKKVITLLPVLIVMGVIFSFSAQPAQQSSKSSDYIAEKVIEIIDTVQETLSIESKPEQSTIDTQTLTFIIRKLAHTFEYMLLGLCISYYLLSWTMKNRTRGIITILIGGLYAVSDEIHQYFVPGRSCELRDVCFDTNGVFLGAIVFIIILKIIKKYQKKDVRLHK